MVPGLAAADFLEREKLAVDHNRGEQFGTTKMEDFLPVLNTDGNSFRAQDEDETESTLIVVAEKIEPLH